MEITIHGKQPADVRTEKVVELVQAANAGLLAKVDKNTSLNEVFSAGMSIAANTITTFLELGADPESLRSSVMELWNMLPATSKEKVN